MSTLRHYITISILSCCIAPLFMLSCQYHADHSSEAKAIFVQDVQPASSTQAEDEPKARSTIELMPEPQVVDVEVIASPLNHYTSLAVGLYQDQYAVVVKTNTKAKKKGDVTPDLALFNEQPFADEVIEDEVVLEPIAIATESVVEEGPGVNPFGPGDTIGEDLVAKSPEVVTPPNPSSADFDITQINAAYLLGKFNPATHPSFTKVEKKYGSRAGMYIRKDTYAAYIKMYDAAAKEGIKLTILSATRSFSGQKRIWEAKWTGRRKVGGKDLSQAIPFGTDRAKKILEFSAMPGTSRHHWGTDIDLCALNNLYFESGQGKKIYDWLTQNAHKYGFHQPYTADRSTGHSEEKWHWSYTPVSKPLTGEYTRLLTNETITGFLGEETAKDIQILENYVLGVDEDCKEQ